MAKFLVEITEMDDKPGAGCLLGTLGILALFALVYWLVGMAGVLYSEVKEKYNEVKEKITNHITQTNHESSKIPSDSTTYFLKKTNNSNSDSIIKEKDTTSLISTIIRPDSTYDVKSYLGKWYGKYGIGKITIIISDIDEYGKVSGSYYLEDKNVTFKLYGIKKGNEFELRELGNNEWDGSFKFKIIDNAVNGNWISNNGELTRDLILTRQ